MLAKRTTSCLSRVYANRLLLRSKAEALQVAESIPGPATDVISDWCLKNNKYVAFGMLELGPNNALYNACPIVGPNGLIGNYRKIHLPFLGVDRFVTTGDSPYQVYDLDGLRVGVHICYDGSFPNLLARWLCKEPTY